MQCPICQAPYLGWSLNSCCPPLYYGKYLDIRFECGTMAWLDISDREGKLLINIRKRCLPYNNPEHPYYVALNFA